MLRRTLLSLPLAAGILAAPVPAPQSHFGHPMGQDRTLLDWNKVVSYFQALEMSSDRIRVREFGKSTEGRPMIVAMIAAPETIRNLDRYRDIQARLADPRLTPPADAEKLIAESKTVVLITCSVHATEVASTMTAVEFAHRLLTEDKPKFRAILANTVFLLVPTLNPDGLDLVTGWYRKTLGTPYEGTSPPELYQKYVGHDNNRDWYMFSQAENRHTISQLHNVWRPQIVYDVHQQGPNASRMFVPPWMDPIEPNIDPIIAQMCNMIGSGMAADLTAAGRKGVVVNAIYDFWTPGRHYQAYHGGLRILTESASVRLATPVTIKPDQISQSANGYDPRARSWNHLEPWLGGNWTLRDIIDDQLIAFESCLYQAAVRREDMLRAFYRLHQNAVARNTPFAFVIPSRQTDPGSAQKLLETLSFGMVEIETAGREFQADGKTFPAGSYVLLMQQPYSSFAKTLLERQVYPDLRVYPGGPPKRPYDVTAHTLPLLMGVDVVAVNDRFQAPLRRRSRFPFPRERELSASDIASYRRINEIWNRGESVHRSAATGDFSAAAGCADCRLLKRPRVALYKSYVPSMDEGWTRWILEQFAFSYASVRDKDLRSDSLRQRFDVILFADQTASSIAQGHRKGSMPEEFTGGLGEAGQSALRKFAAEGGKLIFLNHASEYAVKFLGVEANNVLDGVSNRDFYCPGSLLNVSLDTSSPLAYGLPPTIAVWSERSPAWDSQGAVARYTGNSVLASGWLLGEKFIAGKAALLDIPVGQGRVILFGMRPQYRAQSYQAFKLLFNALLY
jgi:hypothetical protein